MTVLGVGLVVLAAALVLAAWLLRRHRTAARDLGLPAGPERVLFPYVAAAAPPPALDVALRLARADSGTLVPVFLARVPLRLGLDAPLPRQSEVAMPLQEQIEARAFAAGVPVDSRIERGRSYRHALTETIAHERFDRIVVAAAAPGMAGFSAEDVAWLLQHAPGEIVVLRGGDPAANGHHPPRR